ncbi:MAG TPA: AAA family ATPase [bacterium]|nr:AAA family ATPase [bacterium]
MPAPIALRPTSAMSTLQEQLRLVGYRISPELALQVQAALHTQPTAGCFLAGPAGSGKTFLAEAVAKVQDRRTYFFQAFPGCRKEELYQTIVPDADQPSGFRTQRGVLPQAAQASLEGPTALILDEWDKTHPSTDAFLLDFLQNGRITLPGSEIRADQRNLAVFLTLNDERELSEPLVRRLPLVELPQPAPLLVEQALRDTHGDHQYLPAAVTLYQRSLLVKLVKPVTIQELRQLLDAITLLGHQADWNRLVFQFVSKSWDDHELLKSAEALPLMHGAGLDAERPSLDADKYAPVDAPSLAGQGLAPRMPHIHRDWLNQIPARTVEASGEQLFGVVPRSESGYDGVARALLARKPQPGLPDDAADLKIAQVGDTEIIVFQALSFENPAEWALILKDGGELLLESRHTGEITQQMLLEFKAGALSHAPDDPERCRVYSLTGREILMRYRSLKMRWTPEVLEVVTADYAPTRELWDFLYGPHGVVLNQRLAEAKRVEEQRLGAGHGRPERPANEQLRDDYLFVLRDYRALAHWFDLLIQRNLKVWGRVTCEFRNKTVIGSILALPDFLPEKEAPENKEEAEAIAEYNRLNQPCQDYYGANETHVESELQLFVGKNGEFPPAVEDGGIFGLHEVHLDLQKIKREGLKIYMRKAVREA